MNHGKLVIFFVFGLSAVMGAYAWWHHYTQGRRCLELWGAEAGQLIRYAPQVEVMKLDKDESEGAETIQIDSRSYSIVARSDITATPGLVHARQALIEDASYLWEADLDGPSTWQYVLRFSSGEQQVDVALDCDQGRVRLVRTDRQAALKPHLTTAYESRLPRWLGLEATASRSAQPVTAGTR